MSERIYTVEQHGPRIEAFLRNVIDLAGFDLDFEVATGENPHPEIEDPELVVRFWGPDVDLVLGNKGELLLALEYLTMEALRMPSDHHERLCFDANDYRMLRIAELRLSAATAAERVKRSNTPFRFSPMSSRERRIIHLALRNETEVRSESAGTGPFRQVVIYPAGMASLPEPPPRPFNERPRSGGPPPRRGGPGGGGDRDRDRRGPSRGPRRGPR
ncbi:MAG: R3H domain-containing nucleic acid-binding protein [Bryobacteraceae bacterium]